MIRAVLFDMDGVLFDTKSLGLRAMETIAGKLGYPIKRSLYISSLGVPNDECEVIYKAELGDAFPYNEAITRFRDYFSEYNRKNAMPYKAGLMACLEGLHARGMKIVLATSTVRPLVMEYFAKMPEIARYFNGMVCGGEVPHGKPAPDIYLAAAQTAGFEPAQCLGVEDSLNGIKAVRASGARCVMIPDLLPFAEQYRPYVDDLLASLHELCPLIDRLNA